MVSERLWMSPSTMPSTCRSPALIKSPRILRSELMIEGAALRGVGRVLSAPVPILAGLTPGLPLLLAFENIAPRLQEIPGEQGPAVDENLVMHMRPRAPPGRAEQPDLLAVID